MTWWHARVNSVSSRVELSMILAYKHGLVRVDKEFGSIGKRSINASIYYDMHS